MNELNIEQLAAITGTPVEDILLLIENLHYPASKMEEFESIYLKASKAFNEFSAAAAPFIEEDNRPWYEKVANKGGKKRKKNYNNRQPWRK